MNIQTTGNPIQAIWQWFYIPKRLNGARFDTYLPQSKSQEQALESLKAWAEKGIEKINQGTGLFIHGPVGTGKSHLVISMIFEIICSNPEKFARRREEWQFYPNPPEIKFAFINVVDLLATIKGSFSGNECEREKADDLMHQVNGFELIVLDDIGAEKPTEWVEEQLYAIIDFRYRNQMTTIFTTNCTVGQLENQIGSRSVSRIIDMTDGIKVDGPDYRKRKLA